MYGMLVVLWFIFRYDLSRAIAILVTFAVCITLTLKLYDVGGPKYLYDAFRFMAFFLWEHSTLFTKTR